MIVTIIKASINRILFCKRVLIDASTSYFSDGDRVSFIGDSITKRGLFIHGVQKYYISYHAKKNVHFYNCGIPGDVLEGALRRLKDDCLLVKPTHAVIMFGMNDLALEDVQYYDKINSAAVLSVLTKYQRNLDTLVGNE